MTHNTQIYDIRRFVNRDICPDTLLFKRAKSCLV
jgi:hypothetical protein